MSDKPFRPMLATDADLTKVRFPVLASAKLDGIRCLAMDGRAMSRSMKPLPNRHVQHLFAEWGQFLEGLDGELMVGDPTAPDVYRTTTSHVMSEDKEFDFTFWVFDRWDTPSMGFMNRHQHAKARVDALNLPWVRLLSHVQITDQTWLDDFEGYLLDLGYEGVMLRDPAGPYKQGRSTVKEGWLLKVKRHADAEAVVIGVEEEMHNANEAEKNELGRTKRSTQKAGLVGKGTMGSLVVRGLNGAFKGVEFNIGTGFTAADRASPWPIGTVVKYKYLEIGVKDKPRHPVYLGIRAAEDMEAA